jgi:4'-phosphopantetheinyl transferase
MPTTPRPHWPRLASSTKLQRDQLHVWAVPIAGPLLATDQQLLSVDEQTRASRFRLDRVRQHFITARARLRMILSTYLDIHPAAIRFVYDKLGKPALDNSTRGDGLFFNLAHSGELALVAVTYDCEVGIDVEHLRPVRHAEGITRRFFHHDEAADVLACRGPERAEAFFRCWTRKEAVVKAIGKGLQFPLSQFRVPVQSDTPEWLGLPQHALQDVKLPTGRVWLQAFVPCDHYVGAVATLGVKRVSVFRLLEV